MRAKKQRVKNPEFAVMSGRDPLIIFTLPHDASLLCLLAYRPGDKEVVKANERFIYNQVFTMKVDQVRIFWLTPEDVESKLTVRRTA